MIYIGTFSKAIAPAIRVSYMVLLGDLLDIYRRDCSFYSCTVSRIDQRILNEFIRDGYFERHLNKMRLRYRAKHDLLLAGLEPFKKQFVILSLIHIFACCDKYDMVMAFTGIRLFHH